MLELVKPLKSELKFRQRMFEKSANWDFGMHPEAFMEKDWDAFYEKISTSDEIGNYYRYVYCIECCAFIGLVTLERQQDPDLYELKLLVDVDIRNCGYGSQILKIATKQAKELGGKRLSIQLKEENPYRSFFLKRGFTHDHDDWYILAFSAKN